MYKTVATVGVEPTTFLHQHFTDFPVSSNKKGIPRFRLRHQALITFIQIRRILYNKGSGKIH